MITTTKFDTTTSSMRGRGATSKPQTAGMSAKELQEMVRRAREEVKERKVRKSKPIIIYRSNSNIAGLRGDHHHEGEEGKGVGGGD